MMNFSDSAREIARFLQESFEDGKEDATIEEKLAIRARKCANTLESDENSFEVDFEDYPGNIKRISQHVFPRPIVIDGCSVSRQLYTDHKIEWEDCHDSKECWYKDRILASGAILEIAIKFLLMGHKVVVLLPIYYKQPVFDRRKSKVDNLTAYQALAKVGLIKYGKFHSSGPFFTAMHELSIEWGAVLVSSGVLWKWKIWNDRTVTPFFIGQKGRETLTLPMAIAKRKPTKVGRNKRIDYKSQEFLHYELPVTREERRLTMAHKMTLKQQVDTVNILHKAVHQTGRDLRGTQLLLKMAQYAGMIASPAPSRSSSSSSLASMD